MADVVCDFILNQPFYIEYSYFHLNQMTTFDIDQ